MPIENLPDIQLKRKSTAPLPSTLAPGEPLILYDDGTGHGALYAGSKTGIPVLIAGGPGVTGPQGTTGIGIQGTTGIGIQGTTGIGIQGVTGIGVQGVTGIGVQGVTGTAGTAGSPGIQGATGIQGVQGFQGVTGAPGTVGPQGSTGLAGAPGNQGTTGGQGIQGLQGVTGIGVQGVTGLAGTPGITGLMGRTGVQGVTGLMPTISGTSGQGVFVGASNILSGSPMLTYGTNKVFINAAFTTHSLCVDAQDSLGRTIWGTFNPCQTAFGIKLIPMDAGGRLSASSTSSTAWNVGGSTPFTIYYTPHAHGCITLWDSNSSQWARCTLPSSPLSISSGSLTSSVPSDIFAYVYGWDSSGPVLDIRARAWTNTTTRNSTYAISQQDGVWTRTADKGDRYLGTVFPNSPDSLVARTIWNAENQLPMPIKYNSGGGGSVAWTISTTSRLTRHYGATVPQKAVEFCTGLPNTPCSLVAEANIQAAGTNGIAYLGIGLDEPSSNPLAYDGKWVYQRPSDILAYTVSGPAFIPNAGYHWLSIIEGAIGTGSQNAWLPVFLSGHIMG